MSRIELIELRRDIARGRMLRERDRLAELLRWLEQRAVAAWGGWVVTPRADPEDPDRDIPPAPALVAIALQLRAWILELADRGTFARWGVADAGDLHDLQVPVPTCTPAGWVRGDVEAIATSIVLGGARRRGWRAAGELPI